MNTRYPIVIAIDNSELAEVVLEHGFDQAARHSAPDIHVLRVVDHAESNLESGLESNLESEQLSLQSAIGDALGSGGDRRDWRMRAHVCTGKAADEIVGLAAEVGARLLVIGRFHLHGRRSIADRVLENAPCPTLVIGTLGPDAESEPVCPACAATREESDGHRWFCTQHAAPGRLRLSSLVPSITSTKGSFY